MKIQTSLIAAALGLGFVSLAGAQNYVYMTGSTAFRNSVFTAIKAQFDGGNPTVAAFNAKSGDVDGHSAKYMKFTGQIGGVDYIVKCVWSGSEGGIAATVNPGANPVTFLSDSASGINTTDPGAGDLDASPTPPDIAMADTSQAVSLTPTPALGVAGGGPVGIIPFTWAKNAQTAPFSSTYNNLTNLTHSQIRKVLSGPQVAALITGDPADTSYVYAVGRKNTSGTRVNCLADCGYGIKKPVDQWWIDTDEAHSSALNLTEAFDDGYESGGTVAKVLAITGSQSQTDPVFGGTGWYAIGYLGVGDAAGLPWLTLNGVPESTAAIREGQYSYWGREHELTKIGIGSIQNTFANNLAASIPGTLDNVTGIDIATMHAEKTSDVADPSHL